MTALSRTFQIHCAPDAVEAYEKAQADEAAAALIANRATDDTTRESAHALHEKHRAAREALEDDIAAGVRVITVTRLAPPVYGRLVVQHPPRPGDEFDARMGFNTDTFDAALMAAAITRVEDAHGTEVDDFDWPTAAAVMSFGQYQQIVTTVIGMHTSRDAVPFSLDAWRARQT